MGVVEKSLLLVACFYVNFLECRLVRGSGYGYCCLFTLNDFKIIEGLVLVVFVFLIV